MGVKGEESPNSLNYRMTKTSLEDRNNSSELKQKFKTNIQNRNDLLTKFNETTSNNEHRYSKT